MFILLRSIQKGQAVLAVSTAEIGGCEEFRFEWLETRESMQRIVWESEKESLTNGVASTFLAAHLSRAQLPRPRDVVFSGDAAKMLYNIIEAARAATVTSLTTHGEVEDRLVLDTELGARQLWAWRESREGIVLLQIPGTREGTHRCYVIIFHSKQQARSLLARMERRQLMKSGPQVRINIERSKLPEESEGRPWGFGGRLASFILTMGFAATVSIHAREDMH